MKRIILSPLVITCTMFFAFSQSPQYVPYQAVARNSAGNLLVNQLVGLRFTIRETSATGTIDYQETQTATTNSLGLFAVNIGSGTLVGTSPAFTSIPWGNAIAKYTQVEIDPSGGTSYTNMGAAQVMSVPYALYAGSANAVTSSGFANPIALTGMSAINGSATTAMRSDASPAINPAITPTWTGTHTFSSASNYSALFTGGNVGIGTSSPTSMLHTIASGAKTAAYIGNELSNTATSSTASITKTGVDIQSIGSWNGTSAINVGLNVNATGGTTNYAATFQGGNVGMGNASPNASAILDLTNTSTNLGFLPPVTSTRPSAPTNGLIIYNSSNNCMEYYTNGAWQTLSCPCSGSPSVPGTITGTSSNLCVSSVNTYSIAAVPGATSYTWTAPTGCNIVVAGTSYGTSYTGSYISISLTMGGLTGGNLTVSASNQCGSSAANSGLALSYTQIPTITWTSDPLVVGYNQSAVHYAIATVSGATNYAWSLSGGTTTTTTLTGASDNSISVTFSNGTQTYTPSGYQKVTTNITVYVTAPYGSCASTVGTSTVSPASGGRATYSYTGGSQSWGGSGYAVSSIFVKLWGAGGGSGWSTGDGPGGGGGFVSGNYTIATPGTPLILIVGQGGFAGVNSGSNPNGATQPYGGGGPSSQGNGYSGAGGGRTAFQITTGTDIATAGAGGGGSRDHPYMGGGGGGGLTGATGTSGNYSNCGEGGTQLGGGVPENTGNCSSSSSINGSKYNGGTGCSGSYGGGGGSGYYGGAGGGNGGGADGPGGGGSSLVLNLTGTVTNTQGSTWGTNSTNNSPQAAGGSGDADYVSGTGTGGQTNSSGPPGIAGGNGYVVIYW